MYLSVNLKAKQEGGKAKPAPGKSGLSKSYDVKAFYVAELKHDTSNFHILYLSAPDVSAFYWRLDLHNQFYHLSRHDWRRSRVTKPSRIST